MFELYEAVKLVPENKVCFITKVYDEEYVHIIGAHINTITSIRNLEPLGYSLQDFLEKVQIIENEELKYYLFYKEAGENGT